MTGMTTRRRVFEGLGTENATIRLKAKNMSALDMTLQDQSPDVQEIDYFS